MKDVRLNSAPISDGVSPTRRRPPRLGKSERSLLADEAVDARTAISRTLRDMKDTLARAADVRSAAKLHPWLVMGCAVAGGFVTGAALAPAWRKNYESAGPTA